MNDGIQSIKPIFCWAGSKRRLLPVLLSLSPTHLNRYIEPFVGSGCLFFAINARGAILGDINEDLISAYKAVRDFPEELAILLSAMPVNEHFYYELRSRHPLHLSPLDQAARFIYLLRPSFE
jgi:DNA adenine methylase